MERVVITGATSSIGLALIDECIVNNIFVLALVNPKSQNISRIPLHQNIKIEKCDISDMSSFNINDISFDSFFHLAWKNTHGIDERNTIASHIDNIRYSVDAVDLAERLGCKVFIGAGSQAEYGRTNEVLTEKTVCHPETAYGISKLSASMVTRLACYQKGIKHIWTRILSSYGPKYLPNTVINYTISELLNERRPSLTSCDQIWDFIYSGDVARALFLLAQYGKDSDVYVIGSGYSQPLKNYLIQIRDIINPNLELGFGDISHPENAVMHLACNIDKIKRDTGFEIQTSFVDGVLKTIDWINNSI